MNDDWKTIFNRMNAEERNQMTALLLQRSSRAQKRPLISAQTQRIIITFTTLVAIAIAVMQFSIFLGSILLVTYSSMFATFTLYAMLRLHLARQRVHWVGE